MERAVEIFVLVNVVVIGLSHTLAPAAWVRFFKILGEQGQAGSLANGFLSLTFGSIIVAFHWTWEGFVPGSVTFLGVAQLIKSFVAFVLPSVGLRSITRPRASSESSYRYGGIIFLAYGALLGWYLWVD